ncbi:MAG: RNA 2',3'-cyclic phosphodiesterase [Thermacetogeniaceae bacterium]|nr:RNA 2',3'-cyclic phosphodiesterase [Thermoanaerobacterales bacterium]NLN20593.1 RNA 2',3'-cyclic phosphodiesterase [Syntrophomonadaceae bacterium]
MSEQIRAFTAVLLQPELQQRISDCAGSLYKLPLDVKWVEKNNFHFTLKFFGPLSRGDIQKAVTQLKIIAEQEKPFYLQCGELTALPRSSHPRVICLSLKGEVDRLQLLWQRIENTLASAGFPKEKRNKFYPHITLGRFRSRGNWAVITKNAGPFPDNKILVNKIHMMASKLTPHGPIYSPLAAIPFSEES